MSLAFLYPLIWTAAIAVAVPLWLHLERRAEKNLVRFSALEFLDEHPLARRRPLWPRDWPLLLLRLLGLLLLVAAFAWPYVPHEAPVVIRESRVYVLDNTLSNQAEERFHAARHQLAEELAAANRDTQIAVVELTSTPRVLVHFGDDRQAALATLNDLPPSHQRGPYLPAFRLAASLLDDSLGQERSLTLLGDSQENQWQEGQHAPPFLKNVKIDLPEVPAKSLPNISLSRPELRRAFVGDLALVECAVRVDHPGTSPQATLVYMENGREMLRRDVELGSKPESLTFVAQWETDATQWLRGEARLENVDDPLAADNRVFFSLPPVKEGTVTLVARSTYLHTALAPEIMRGRWTCTAFASPTAEAALPDADVACIESQFLSLPPARELLQRQLDAGRGVLLVLDQVGPAARAFLHDYGIEVQEDVQGRLSSPAGSETATMEQQGTSRAAVVAGTSRAASSGEPFRFVYLDHPLFHPFRSPDFGNLLDVRVSRYRRLQAAESLPLVFSAAGDVLLMESTRTKGRLFVLAFALDRDETNWPLQPTFVPFLDLCLTQARALTEPPTEFAPGELCVWRLPPGQQAQQLVLRDAAGGSAVSAEFRDGQARFRIPDQPGQYALCYDGSHEIDRLLDVNPHPDESLLTYAAEPESLRAWQAEENESPEETATPDALDLTKMEILSQRFWWWLLAAALLAFLAESVWTLRVAPSRS